MADVKIRDLSSAASVADTDIVEITVDPGGTPATKKATVAQIRGPGGGGAGPTGEQWFAAVKATATAASVSPPGLGGGYTTGQAFGVFASASLLGVRFWWGGSAGTVKVSVWSGGSRIASKSVTVSGAGEFDGVFASPVSLSAATVYWLTIWEETDSEYTAGLPSPIASRTAPEFGSVWFRLSGYSYAGGDAQPTTITYSGGYMLLAPLF